MTEQTEGNESNTTVASVVQSFQSLVYAGVNDALALSGDTASMDAFNKAVVGPNKALMDLAVLAIAQNNAGIEGIFDVATVAAVAAAVAKVIPLGKSPGGAVAKALAGILAGEGANIPLSNTNTTQAAKEWLDKWGEALTSQPANFPEPASEAAFDQGLSDWVDKWGEALIEQPLMFPENVGDSESVAQAIGNWFDQWGEALFKEPIRFPDGSGEASIFDAVSDFFQDALNGVPVAFDPLTLDLDGDGIETLPADGTVLFDHNGDGIKQGTGWVAPADGLLVLDKNGNGLIDNGSELFGDNTVKVDSSLALNGFDTLLDYDSNGDGRIDAGDVEFANLRIWQDTNSDGISQSGELKTLTAAGVAAINLDSEASTLSVGNDNFANAVGTFERLDGSENMLSAAAASLDFASSPFYQEFTDTVAIPETLQHLPDMQGSGARRDLLQAAASSVSLAATLSEYSSASGTRF